MKQKGPMSEVQLLLFLKSRTGEGHRRLSTGTWPAEKDGPRLHGSHLGTAWRAWVPGVYLNLERKKNLTDLCYIFFFKTESQSPGWSSVHLVIQVDLELPIPPRVLGLQVNVISIQGQVVYLLSMLGIHQANICQLSYASSLLHLLMCVSAFMKPGWYYYLFPEVDDEGESNLGFWGNPNY